MQQPVAQADHAEKILGFFPGPGRPGEFGAEGDVFQGGQGRDQMKILEDETEPAAAQFGQLVFVQFRQVLPVDHDRSGGGGIEARDQAEEGGFAAPGSALHGHKLTRRKAEVDSVQNVHLVASPVEALGQVPDFDQDKFPSPLPNSGFLF